MSEPQDSPDAHVHGVTLVTTPATGQLADSVVVAATGLAAGQTATGPQAPPPLTAVQLSLYTGFTMAVLYGNIQAPAAGAELPTAHELQPPQRRDLELSRLRNLLEQMSGLPGLSQAALPAAIPANYADSASPANGNPPAEPSVAFRASLNTLNLSILQALTGCPPEVQLAYELGRSLRDTVNPPTENPAGEASGLPPLDRQLGRERVAKLQEWLATLATQLPAHAAAVVATSLGRWSELVAATSTQRKKSDAAGVTKTMCDSLLPQGDIWLTLLTGERPAAGLLSPEAYVAAGELALRRSSAIARGILRHYWVAAVIGAVALGGILYLIASTLSGGAEVWTTIATITGSLGISTSAIASTSSRLAAEAERPVFAIAEEDAMAWAITALPPVSLGYRAVQQLRKAGVTPRTSLGRV